VLKQGGPEKLLEIEMRVKEKNRAEKTWFEKEDEERQKRQADTKLLPAPTEPKISSWLDLSALDAAPFKTKP
jgi:hypothetical protein